ncbi:unannotated protein [freshwater metagenome]|uniref:Unannotated protein n=1 Tax=freshwater metagenome TaxID=449393 RepID=A0A6J6C3W5_9ZZZZ
MIHPLIGERFGGVAVDAVAGGSGVGVAFPWGAARGLGNALVGLAFDGDRDRGEALFVPLLDPLFESSASAAVHEHDAGNFAAAFRGQTEPGKDARGLTLIREALEKDGLDGARRNEAFGGVDDGRRLQVAKGGDLFA